MRTAFILALIGFFFLLALTSRTAALYTYWWFGVFRPQDWVWGALNSYRLPLVAAILLVLPSFFQKKFPRFDNPIAILMIILCLLELLANIVNGCSQSPHVIKTLTVMNLFILTYVVLLTAELVQSKKILFWLFFVIAVSIGFHSGKGGIYALLTGASYYGATQLQGFLSGSNGYAIGTAMMLFYMIFAFQYIDVFGPKTIWIRKGLKFMMLVIIFGSFYNVIATESRGSFLALVAGLFVWFLFHQYRIRMLTVIFFTLAIGLTVIPLPDNFTDRIQSVFVDTEELDSSAASRPHFWNTALAIAKDYPIGTGPGCYPYYYNIYDSSDGQYGYYRSVHSSHFQILSDTGFLGTLVWIAIFLVTFKCLWQIRKKSLEKVPTNDSYNFYLYAANALFCSQLVFMLGGSFYEMAYSDIGWLNWGLVIGLDRLLKKQLKEEDEMRESD
jgi:putative inorganic carbon (HCO3(-)) transporter